MHGNGSMEWLDGSIYEGDYFHGKKEGYGKFKFPSGACYTGGWLNGQQHGAGTLVNAEGDLEKQGRWEEGNFV